MAVTVTIYDEARYNLGNKALDLDTDTIVMRLYDNTYTPATSHSVANLTGEVSATNTGYTTGGYTLASKTLTKGSGKTVFTSAAPSWTAGSAGLTTYKAVLVDTTANSLLCCIDFGGSQAVTSGNTLTINPDATNGWLYI